MSRAYRQGPFPGAERRRAGDQRALVHAALDQVGDDLAVFLRRMYEDSCFPDHIVDQGRAILLRLCERIEAEQPSDLEALYAFARAATEEFNLLDAEFHSAGSGIETAAREWIAEDFGYVASAYGFTDAVGEELIAGRDW